MKTKNPSKQRKRDYETPQHLRKRRISAHLSAELKSKYNTVSFPVRKGDAVRIMRGDRRGYEGKITMIDMKKARVYIDGITREKADGTQTQIPIQPSKILITNLNLDDKKRQKALERRGSVKKDRIKEKSKHPLKEEDAKDKSIVKTKPRAKNQTKGDAQK